MHLLPANSAKAHSRSWYYFIDPVGIEGFADFRKNLSEYFARVNHSADRILNPCGAYRSQSWCLASGPTTRVTDCGAELISQLSSAVNRLHSIVCGPEKVTDNVVYYVAWSPKEYLSTMRLMSTVLDHARSATSSMINAILLENDGLSRNWLGRSVQVYLCVIGDPTCACKYIPPYTLVKRTPHFSCHDDVKCGPHFTPPHPTPLIAWRNYWGLCTLSKLACRQESCQSPADN